MLHYESLILSIKNNMTREQVISVIAIFLKPYFERHSRPWRTSSQNECIIVDSHGNTVIDFLEDENIVQCVVVMANSYEEPISMPEIPFEVTKT